MSASRGHSLPEPLHADDVPEGYEPLHLRILYNLGAAYFNLWLSENKASWPVPMVIDENWRRSAQAAILLRQQCMRLLALEGSLPKRSSA